MAAKNANEAEKIEEQIKSALAQRAVLIGTRSVIRALKTAKVKFVVLARNTPDNIKSDIEYYAKLANVPVRQFGGTGKELGVFLAKPFAVTAIAVK